MSLTHTIGLSSITVEHNGFEREKLDGFRGVYAIRPAYTVTITTPKWQHVDNRLCGGVGEPPCVRKAFGAFISFLMACIEWQPNNENAKLFPANVVEWAQQREYELTELDMVYNSEQATNDRLVCGPTDARDVPAMDKARHVLPLGRAMTTAVLVLVAIVLAVAVVNVCHDLR